MNYNQILQYIVTWIKENHNNEITGSILQDVLVQIVQYVKDGSDNVDVDIQELQNQIDAISLAQEVNVFEGVEDPNVVPPTETFAAADIFVKTNTNDVFIFTGADWFKITQYFNPAEHDLDEFQNASTNPYARMEDLPAEFDPTYLEINIQNLENNKVDKESGKGLSDENFSLEEKEKLANIEEGAQVNVIPDWDADTDNPRRIDNKPTKTSNFINDGATGVSPYAELDETLVKLEENMTFTVGVGKDFETISEAVNQALHYYPNLDYRITIVIDEDFEIDEELSWENLNLSHITIKTLGEILYAINDSNGIAFTFDGCLMPILEDFKLGVKSGLTIPFCGLQIFKGIGFLLIGDWSISGFKEGIRILHSSSNNMKDGIINIPVIATARGISISNSSLRIEDTKINSTKTVDDNTNIVGILFTAGASVYFSKTAGSTNESGFFGKYRHFANVQVGSTLYMNANVEFGGSAFSSTFLLHFGSTVIDRTTNPTSANIPINVQTAQGLYIKYNNPLPFYYTELEGYKFNSGDVTISELASDLGKINSIGVDETGKLVSIKRKSQTLLNQYTLSTQSGDSTDNLIQPDYGLALLTSDDMQENSSFNGELIISIENNNLDVNKVIELFGVEIYNNNLPNNFEAKITFSLNFFNQDGSDIDYKLDWQYISSGEILFGSDTVTIDNTVDKDFELITTGDSTDNFNLTSARLWRN